MTTLLAATKDGFVPEKIALLLLPDLSLHAVIDVVPVMVVESAASNHNEQPLKERGVVPLAYGTLVINEGIYLELYFIKNRKLIS
jgi:hypothetical protein